MAGIRQTTDAVVLLPDSLAEAVRRAFRRFPGDIYELRLIRDRGVFAVTSDGVRFLQVDGSLTPLPGGACAVTADELEEIVQRAVGYSGFAHEEELRRCFLTRGDGTRIGIAFSGGAGSLRTGGVHSLNIRLPVAAAEALPAALKDALTELTGGLLIAGAPNTGKTTLLRACCRFLGGGEGGVFRKVCVIDERMELAGANGAFDLGCCTDVIAGRDKREAILTALRLLSPEVIVCDEIGSARETESILEGLNSGVCFIASMHAFDLTQLVRRGQFLRLFGENVFDSVALLDPGGKGTVRGIYSHDEVADEIRRGGGALLRGGADRRICESPKAAARGAAGQAV